MKVFLWSGALTLAAWGFAPPSFAQNDADRGLIGEDKPFSDEAKKDDTEAALPTPECATFCVGDDSDAPDCCLEDGTRPGQLDEEGLPLDDRL